MPGDANYPAPVPLEPLLESIARVRRALGDGRADLIKDAITQLADVAAIYDPLCRRAHVFKDPDDHDERSKSRRG